MRRDPAILLLALGQTLIWASVFYLFPAMLLRWEQDLGWSKATLTGAITLAILVSAAASPWAGRLIDRGFAAALMGVSAALGGIGLLALSQVTEVWQFYAVWTLIGFAMSGCLYEPCFALITRHRRDRAKPAIILVTLAAGFASTISFPSVYGLSEAFGWRATVIITGVFVAVFVAPLLWIGAYRLTMSAPIAAAPSANVITRRGFLKRPAFWLLAAAFACLALVHSATLQHLLPILDDRGLSAETAVLAASFIGPMQVAGRLAMLATERILSNHAVALAAFLAMGLAIALLLAGSASLILLAAFVLLFGSAYGTTSVLRPLIARDNLGERDFGAKTGALAVPYLAGAALAPYLGALIWGWGGYGLMLSVMLGIMALGTVLYILVHRMAPRT